MVEFADGVASVMQGSSAAISRFNTWVSARAGKLAGACQVVHTDMQLLTRRRRCFEVLDQRRADPYRHQALLFA